MGKALIYRGDCVQVMQRMEPESFTCVLTDPPYGLEFMGKEWDQFGGGQTSRPGIGERQTEWVSSQGWNKWRCVKCGHLTHGGSPCRCAKPDVRQDMTRWRAFQSWNESWARAAYRVLKPGGLLLAFGGTRTFHRLTCAIEDAGFEIRDCLMYLFGSGFPKSLDIGKATEDERWQGYGSALKPAFEPVTLAMKPLDGTFARNALRHGVAGLNVERGRIGAGHDNGNGRDGEQSAARRYRDRGASDFTGAPGPRGGDPSGRFPANLLLDQEAARMLDERSGETTSSPPVGSTCKASRNISASSITLNDGQERGNGFGDSGGPSRFFYTAKAASAERHADGEVQNTHPTVKPLDLMQYLVRLVKMPSGTRILDPFAGSGSTLIAALREGVDVVGIEREEEYVEIARARIVADAPLFNQVEVETVPQEGVA